MRRTGEVAKLLRSLVESADETKKRRRARKMSKVVGYGLLLLSVMGGVAVVLMLLNVFRIKGRGRREEGGGWRGREEEEGGRRRKEGRVLQL